MNLYDIQVTEKHIEEGKSLSCWKCPIALAINERLTGQDIGLMTVGDKYVFLHPDRTSNEFYTYTLPLEAVNFIRTFDRYGKNQVQPFKFSLTINE